MGSKCGLHPRLKGGLLPFESENVQDFILKCSISIFLSRNSHEYLHIQDWSRARPIRVSRQKNEFQGLTAKHGSLTTRTGLFPLPQAHEDNSEGIKRSRSTGRKGVEGTRQWTSHFPKALEERTRTEELSLI